MKNPLYKLFTAALLLAAALALPACGDEQDSRISDDDAVCLKIIRNGGTCGSVGSGTATSTSTETITATTTTTNTSTVTVTSVSSTSY